MTNEPQPLNVRPPDLPAQEEPPNEQPEGELEEEEAPPPSG